MKRIWSYLVPALILFGVLALQYNFPIQVESLRIRVFDIFQQIKPRPYQMTPVRIIDIDDESLEKLGQWPWPRTLLADLIARLTSGGAQAIAFDIVFSERDRTSPQEMFSSWPESESLNQIRSQLAVLPDHDKFFAEAVSKAPAVLAFGLTTRPFKTVPQLKSGFAEHGNGSDRALDYIWPTFRGAVVNLPDLEKAARGNGCFNMGTEMDSTIRRAPALFRLNDSIYPALVLEAMRVFQGASTYKITLAGASGETSFGEKTGLVGIKVGLLNIPTDNRGRIWLYDTGYKVERFIPAWKVLSKDFNLASLEGTVLFIGSSATGIKDMRATPLNPRAPGVEVHAQLAEQMFLGDFLTRPDWAEGAEFTYLVLLGILLIVLLPTVGAILCAVLSFACIALAVSFSWYAFTHWHLLLDPAFPSIVVLLIYLVSSFFNFLRTETERGQIRSAFSRYLSPHFVAKLARDPKQLKLGGEIKVMTFLFTDIRSFTSLSETMTAQELTHFMNSFMTPMTGIILKHNGTIDKYIGDCIMAFWNAPIEDRDHARNACLAGLEMLEFLKGWNLSREQEATAQGKPFLRTQIGIGINTGEACVGNMGSEYRFDYTVLGDEVNLASRLESLTKQYNVSILLGQNTAELVPGLHPRELDTIQVRGKTKPTRIFTLS